MASPLQDTLDVTRLPARGEDHVEELLDEALEETFPASDPPAPAIEVETQAEKLSRKE
jgi:hypothetical protein